jgi:two-component system response regulator VicR
MSVKKKILLADDDVAIRRAYAALLEGEGYEVATARNGEDAVAKFDETSPDLVLLDVMMPKMNGMAACAEIRRRDALTPILFVTAAPSDTAAVRALGLGGDDYIDKTRPTAEMIARINAALRRAAAYASRAAAAAAVAEIGGAKVDFDAMKLVSAEGREADMTRAEAIFLKMLANRRGKCVPAEEILESMHADGNGCEAGLRVTISRLKRKLGRAGSLIVNFRGLGYKLIG